MNISKILPRALVAMLIVSASASVFATSAYPGLTSSPLASMKQVTASADAQSGKTRAQVYAEMEQAERDGLIPIRHNDYPPSARAIESNRVRFAAAEQYWQRDIQEVAAQR